MEKTKKKLKWWGVLLIVVCAVAAVVGLFFTGLNIYFRGSVSDYYKASEKGFVIPNGNSGFIAQGISYDERTNSFFVTGYRTDGTASPISVVNKKSGKTEKTVSMQLSDGSAYSGHAGGISVYGDYVYIAGGDDHCLYVFSYSDIVNGADGGNVKSLGKFDLTSGDDYITAAFTTVYDGKILVGEFYREQNYKTPESHHIEVGGGTNRALAVAFSLDENAEFGIKQGIVEAYSLPDQVQGMCFDENGVYASTSYAVAFSHIYKYSRATTKEKTMNVLGTEISVRLLDSDSLVSDKKIAPMSEEIEIVDGKMYTMCESASNKYIFGKFTGGKWCYATNLEFFAR